MKTVSETLEQPRLNREMRLQNAMITMYCKRHHVYQGKVCQECERLQEMMARKLAFCNGGVEKPTCRSCVKRCYTPVISKQVHTVYRDTRFRMWLRHPALTLRYKIDSVTNKKSVSPGLLSQKSL